MTRLKVLDSSLWVIISLASFVLSYGRSMGFFMILLFNLAFDNPVLTISLMICNYNVLLNIQVLIDVSFLL